MQKINQTARWVKRGFAVTLFVLGLANALVGNPLQSVECCAVGVLLSW